MHVVSARAQRSSNGFRILLSFLLLIGASYVFLHRQELLDQFNVSRFAPSPAIVAINERASFDERGQFLFYASQPELMERTVFNGACRSVSAEQTAILGCYSANRIYLYNVTNPKLDGVKEVTAAHEMLHAAYQRLSQAEKVRVNRLLVAQDLGEDTDRINSLMDEYAKTEPGEEMNELHSIIGSEVRALSPELEAYYEQYFADRSKLVTLAEQYQSVFNELRSQQEGLVSTLNQLADTVEADSVVYKRDLQVLESDIRQFNARANGGTMSRDEYNSSRASLESRQAKLKRDYNAIQAMIALYEEKRTELAAINSESDALNRSINSSLTPLAEGFDD